MGDNLGSNTQVTTDDWVSIWKRILPSNIDKIIIRLQEVDGEDILYKIVASNEEAGTDDPDDAFEICAETTILAGEEATPETLSDPWREVNVYVKSAAPVTPGTAKITVAGG